MEPGFNTRNLNNWRRKGLLQKVRNGWYVLNENGVSEPHRFSISNQIYKPSFISLESALSWYGLIPEGVFITTAISSRKTQRFEGDLGVFTYQSLPACCMVGFQFVESLDWSFKIAKPEKALVDYLHLHPEYSTLADIESLRLNPVAMESLNVELLKIYAGLFENKALDQRLKLLSI